MNSYSEPGAIGVQELQPEYDLPGGDAFAVVDTPSMRKAVEGIDNTMIHEGGGPSVGVDQYTPELDADLDGIEDYVPLGDPDLPAPTAGNMTLRKNKQPSKTASHHASEHATYGDVDTFEERAERAREASAFRETLLRDEIYRKEHDLEVSL